MLVRHFGAVLLLATLSASAAVAGITNIHALCHKGQTFLTWTDAAVGDADASNRYSVYRANAPITAATIASAQKWGSGILPNAGKLFGSAFYMKDRLDTAKPMSVTEEGGQPLPMWSGLAVRTVDRDGKTFYAVQATNEKGEPQGGIVPGENATQEAVEEKVAPPQPILLYDSRDSKTRGPDTAQTCITGVKGLPLTLALHASSAQGGGAGQYGDYYLYFATTNMGYRDGLAGVFSVEERRHPAGNMLLVNSRDAIENPNGRQAMETYWFGYFCTPQWAPGAAPRAYPFTENRVFWFLDYAIRKYGADPERIYANGQSMGAWGGLRIAFHHPEIFAAAFITLPRMRQRGLPSLIALKPDAPVRMPDGKTDYYERMDSVRFATEHHEDLPFLAWSIGRHDGFATWKEQVDMVKALTASHHGFVMAWNDGTHSEGSQPMSRISRNYNSDMFALHRSYPAFGNSSLDGNMGTGDLDGKTLKDGDKEGGINLGFSWKDVADEQDRWSVALSNDLATAEMTVDVTPRRCQKFRLQPGEKIAWSNTAGGHGVVDADAWRLATVPKVRIAPNAATTLTLKRAK
jgi:predicted esterase